MTQTLQDETLTITFTTDNAAFGRFPASEVERILAKITEQVRDEQSEAGAVTRPIHDLNGNRVGEWTWHHSLVAEGY